MKRRTTASAVNSLDLGFLNAATILTRLPKNDYINILLVGCGGTGSHLAPSIGSLLQGLKEVSIPARAFFIDDDHVEPGNVNRQLFCDAEVGKLKAATLAYRYGAAWGVDITAVIDRFKPSIIKKDDRYSDPLWIVVGCVDNAAARQQMARTLEQNQPNEAPDVWWLDCGNHLEAGQVLLGSALNQKQLRKAFPSKKICQALPAPSIQHPELLIAKREKLLTKRQSCAELVASNQQSRDINKRIAAEASDFLTRLILTRDLKRFGCELNLAAGSMRSIYPTPETVKGFFTRK